MAAREDMGSWLEGGPSGGAGERHGSLRLPGAGPGSLAPLSRRIPALAVDWLLCLAISNGFFGGDPLATLAVFAAENVLLVGTVGYTIGHRLLGLRVRTVPPAAEAARPSARTSARSGPGGAVADAGLPGPLRAAVRTALLCLVIPAVVWDADGRSLHDRAAATVLVRR